MDKLVRYMQYYLKYGFLFQIALIPWGFLLYRIGNHGFLKQLYDILSCNFIPWFLTLVFYLIFLVIIPSVRDKKLKRLANLQERDEREEYITGRAARTAYIATFSLMLVALFFSLLHFTVLKEPSLKTGRPVYSFNVGIHYNFFTKSEINEKWSLYLAKYAVFDSDNYSLSNPTIIMFFLAWLLIAFNITARKERLKGM